MTAVRVGEKIQSWCRVSLNVNGVVKRAVVVKLAVIVLAGIGGQVCLADEVKLFAAASLTDAVTELSAKFQSQHPEFTIKKSFASSSVLAKQIENGAQADIFFSADQQWADYLQARGLLNVKSRKNLVSNQLVLIAPKNHPFSVTFNKSFNLANAFSGRWCTGDPSFVPVGKYTQQSFVYYSWWEAMLPRLVSAEDVRTALTFVERGDCALGVVYKTDALQSKKVVEIAQVPDEAHKPIEYPVALMATATTEASLFWTYLQSQEAKSIFIRFGFNPLF